MDLVAQVSHDAKTGTVGNAIQDLVPKLKNGITSAKGSSTADLIIKNMKLAQGKVSGMSRAQQAAVGVGSLAAIGVASNRKLKERRG